VPALALPAPAWQPTPGIAQGTPLLAIAEPCIALARLGQQQQQRPGVLEPMFQALARAATTDPLGDTVEALLSKVPAVPDQLLLGAHDVADGSDSEGPHGQPGGIDVGITAARFNSCMPEGGADVAGARAKAMC